MISIFKRVLRIAHSEAHSAVDKMEDPIKMTEQGIRELKEDYRTSMVNLARAKASLYAIKTENKEALQTADDYEIKAIKLLEQAAAGTLEPQDADTLASQALQKKEQALQRHNQLSPTIQQQEQNLALLEAGCQKIKEQITHWENELATLKARSKIATSTRKLNEQLAQVDSAGTISMLEKMKEKTVAEEALSASYAEMAAADTSLDSKIDAALGSKNTSQSLAELKQKLKKS